MTKTITTAADKDALIAQAASAGLTVTRTSKDCFLADGDDKARVTLTEIRRLIADAHLRAAHEEERAEALALADELREQAAACGGRRARRAPVNSAGTPHLSPTPCGRRSRTTSGAAGEAPGGPLRFRAGGMNGGQRAIFAGARSCGRGCQASLRSRGGHGPRRTLRLRAGRSGEGQHER